jgi:predicted transcriptional regulator
MPHPRVPSEEIDRLGQEWYEKKLRPLVETKENIGKIISIDVETGDYAIADELLQAGERVRMKHPDAAMYAIRIGYNAVYSLGGAITRTTDQ